MEYLMTIIFVVLIVERGLSEWMHHRERDKWMAWSKSNTAEDFSIAFPVKEEAEPDDDGRFVPLEDIPSGDVEE